MLHGRWVSREVPAGAEYVGSTPDSRLSLRGVNPPPPFSAVGAQMLPKRPHLGQLSAKGESVPLCECSRSGRILPDSRRSERPTTSAVSSNSGLGADAPGGLPAPSLPSTRGPLRARPGAHPCLVRRPRRLDDPIHASCAGHKGSKTSSRLRALATRVRRPHLRFVR